MNVIAPFKYFRLHGTGTRYASNYEEGELQELTRHTLQAEDGGRNDVYVYFNNDYNAYAPNNALRLVKILEEIK